ITELSLLTVTNTATDSDLPANALTYELLTGPAGSVIDNSGVITWRPSEAQGPGVYTLTTLVTDSGNPSLKATNSFTVTVTELNTSPLLPSQGPRVANELTQLMVSNTASDSDVPANSLSYQLVNPPEGATIGSDGIIRWTPSEAQGPGVYTLTTVVT